MQKFYILNARFRNSYYYCKIEVTDNTIIDDEIVTDLVCKKFQTAIPGSEISYSLAETTRAVFHSSNYEKRTFGRRSFTLTTWVLN
jgi:hypothetical protein